MGFFFFFFFLVRECVCVLVKMKGVGTRKGWGDKERREVGFGLCVVVVIKVTN